MSFKNTGTFQVAKGEAHTETAIYHANNEIATKFLGKNHPVIKPKTKGTAFSITQNEQTQWYFKPVMKVKKYEIVDGQEVLTDELIDNEDYFRVNWYNLDCCVEVGYFGDGIYNGLNPTIKGKRGEVHLTKDLDWVFIIPDNEEKFNKDTFRLNNPESVELL